MGYDYENDETIQELQDEMYGTSRGASPANTWESLTQQTKMIIGGVTGLLILLIYNGTISMRDGLFYAAIGIIALYLMSGRETERKELSWIECIVRLENLLKFLQDHPIGQYPQIPKGTIKISPIGRKQYFEGKPFKRSFKVSIYEEEVDVEETYFIELDVFTGDIITFKVAPEGVYGDETKDIKFIPHHDALMQKKRDEYLKPNVKGGS